MEKQTAKKTKPDKDEMLLSALITEVKRATKKAESSLQKGLEDAEKVLKK